MRRRHLLIVAILLWLAPTRAAQTDQVDDFINAEIARQRIPGLSLAVRKDGKIVKAAGYGLADRKLRIPAAPDTIYKIGSVSKQFIATGIMLLAGERKLSLDDSLNEYLDAPPASWNAITIRHLLTHTSGLVREAPGFDWSKAQSDADVIRTAYRLPLRFPPGEKWEYSNTGYFALAEVIRKVSGRPWEEYLIEKIFRPFGMNATRPTNTQENLPKRAAGYSDNDRLVEALDFAALRPSGAFLSTVLDLARWDALLDGSDVLSESTRGLMWTPVTLNSGATYPYGFGWELDAFKDHRQVHHGGGLPGFGAEFARFPDDRLTVIVLVNLDDNDVEAIATGVAALYLARAPVR